MWRSKITGLYSLSNLDYLVIIGCWSGGQLVKQVIREPKHNPLILKKIAISR